MSAAPTISVSILTYARPGELQALLANLAELRERLLEIIVVDNCSPQPVADLAEKTCPGVRVIRLERNIGVAGRSVGMEAARGEIVLTLDDDIRGLTAGGLERLRRRFAEDPGLGALTFQSMTPDRSRVCDWVHRQPIGWADRCFPTYEITEGTVAFRRAALARAGTYRDDMFISHEGLDLVLRLLKAGYRVEYDGQIAVEHHHARGGRAPWRRYYYDTRNLFWIAVLHMPARYAAGYLARGLAGMLYYSLRDGHGLTWLRAVRDGLLATAALRRERLPWPPAVDAYIRAIDRQRPPLWKLIVSRLRQRDFRLDL